MALPHHIVGFLGMIASRPAAVKSVPLAIIANLTGVSRMTLYRARLNGRVSADTAELLTRFVRAFEAGKLKFRRTGPRSRYPNHWEVVET